MKGKIRLAKADFFGCPLFGGNYSHYYATVLETPEVSYENVNESLFRPVVASNTGTGFTTASVNDNNFSTRWASNNAENQWIFVDLQSKKQIANVALNWEAAYGKGFKIQVSDNATTWTDLYTTTTGAGGNQLIPVNGAGRYVRMLGTQRINTAWGYSLWEMGVYSNLALNRPIVASSVRTQTPAVPAANANDSDVNTRWSSNANNNEWIYVDLQSVRQISSVVLDWEGAYATAYKIQVSNDSVNWTDAYSTTAGAGGLETITLSATGRYVRMLGVARATGYGYSLWEFGVY